MNKTHEQIPGDDTRFLQWHIDNKVEIPAGQFRTTATLQAKRDGKMLGRSVVITASPDVRVVIEADHMSNIGMSHFEIRASDMSGAPGRK